MHFVTQLLILTDYVRNSILLDLTLIGIFSVQTALLPDTDFSLSHRGEGELSTVSEARHSSQLSGVVLSTQQIDRDIY